MAGFNLIDLFEKNGKHSISDYWKAMQKIKTFEEQSFYELSIIKIRLLAVYCFVSFLGFTVPIVAMHHISILGLLNVFLSFNLFFLWYRFYAYRDAFSNKNCISVGEAVLKLKYPRFLVQLDFTLFAKCRWFCKKVFYDSKKGILYCRPDCMKNSKAGRDSVVEEKKAEDQIGEVAAAVTYVTTTLHAVAESMGQEQVKEVLNSLLKVVEQIGSENFDSQFGRHLLNYYLTPLADLLSTNSTVDTKAQEELLELLEILTSAIQGIAKVEELTKGNDFIANISAMLQLAKLNGLEG